MTPTKEQIESEAENEYPSFFVDGSSSAHGQALKRKGFIVGVEWALSQPSDACEFAEWTFKKGWMLCTESHGGTSFWMLLEAINPGGEGEKSTTELYQIFLKEKQK